MTDSPFRVIALDPDADRRAFKSGSEPLDDYFHKQVGQDTRRRVAQCFVAVDDNGCIAGYYTLAAGGVPLNLLPWSTAKKLPRYPMIPIALMGRLAVDATFHGAGLGGALLADAIDRSASSELAAFALMVDAKDDSAAAFYTHHGFIALPDSERRLFLPLAGYGKPARATSKRAR